MARELRQQQQEQLSRAGHGRHATSVRTTRRDTEQRRAGHFFRLAEQCCRATRGRTPSTAAAIIISTAVAFCARLGNKKSPKNNHFHGKRFAKSNRVVGGDHTSSWRSQLTHKDKYPCTAYHSPHSYLYLQAKYHQISVRCIACTQYIVTLLGVNATISP